MPQFDDAKLFEHLILEGMQAGLSWITILRKREAFRRAFRGFGAERVARFTERDVARLMTDAAIIRNRAKIEAAIHNAKRFLEVQDRWEGFHRFQWSFVDGIPVQFRRRSMKQVPATSRISDRFSKELKACGFRFVGSTTIYAHMQATGMVNDHLISCFRHDEVAQTTLGKTIVDRNFLAGRPRRGLDDGP